jgi:hypothetical protein
LTVAVNNREIAMLIWSGIVLIAILSRRDTRPPIWNLVKAITQPLIIGTLLALAVWVAGLALAAEQFGIWEVRLINETVWWFLATGVVLWFSLPRVATEDQFFRKVLQRVVTFSLLGEVFINLVVFPLAVEFFLVPFLTVLIALEAFTRGQGEYASAQKLCERVSALIGLALFACVAIRLIGDPSQIDLAYIARLIALPAWLTLFSLPLIFLIGMWFAYQGVFHMIGFWAADKRTARRAKLLLLRHLNVRPRRVGRFDGLWQRRLTRAASDDERRAVIEQFMASHSPIVV